MDKITRKPYINRKYKRYDKKYFKELRKTVRLYKKGYIRYIELEV